MCSGNEPGYSECTDSKVMTWDTELEDLAIGYAKTCPNDHNPDKRTPTYSGKNDVGENLYWKWGTSVTLDASYPVEDWYSEVF